jgi:hypothetical protein
MSRRVVGTATFLTDSGYIREPFSISAYCYHGVIDEAKVGCDVDAISREPCLFVSLTGRKFVLLKIEMEINEE